MVYEPELPMIAIIGGSKIATKIDLIESMLSRADKLVIGGAMANTFLKAMGKEVGKSLVDENEINEAKRVIRVASQKNIDLVLPLIDVAVGRSVDKDAVRTEKPISEISGGDIILDFGEKSVEEVKRALVSAKTVIWNGPLGMTELDQFAYGTEELAKFLAKHEAKTVIGGGDSAGFIHSLGMENDFFHVSTGGGASLEFLSGKIPEAFELIKNK